MQEETKQNTQSEKEGRGEAKINKQTNKHPKHYQELITILFSSSLLKNKLGINNNFL